MDLISRLKSLVGEERRIAAELLKLLLQVESTRLFAERGYSSLYEFCVRELGYSEGAAYRRVSAMRLLKRDRTVEDKIISGEITLSNAAKVETLYRQAKKKNIILSPEQRSELFQAALGTSSMREIERKAEELGIPLPNREAILPRSIEEKLEVLGALLSHKYPLATKEELLHHILDETIERERKKRGMEKDENPKKEHCNIASEVQTPSKSQVKTLPAPTPSRYIPQKLRAKVLSRDHYQCTYFDLKTKRKCTAVHFLEIDHKIPVAFGGKSEEENLRTLCRTHNQLAAREAGLLFSIPEK